MSWLEQEWFTDVVSSVCGTRGVSIAESHFSPDGNCSLVIKTIGAVPRYTWMQLDVLEPIESCVKLSQRINDLLGVYDE